jgi:predicted ATPase/class 3 adenylate cyclase
MAGLPSGTVTFLFTDVEGSTARWEQQPEVMRPALARHDALLRASIQEHDGHVVKTMGDAFHAVFVRAPDAVAAALDAQRRLQAEPWGETGPLRVRMALHTGAAEERDGDYYGPPLNRAARLLGIGHGGQILLSEVTAALARDDLPAGATLDDLGTHRLKDLTRPERVFQVAGPELAAVDRPLASLDARPHNLPVQTTPLIGREQAGAAVQAMLLRDDVRLVTLTGPGGTGKTRLSLQVAAEVLDRFEHGAFFVELAPISDPGLVVSAIAQALGVQGAAGRSLLDVLVDALRGRELLLVLDNFEQVLPAATEVDALLRACPRLTVLVTSRAALQLRGEHEFPVPPLALPLTGQASSPAALSQYAAVALFIERATAVKPDFTVTNQNAPAIAEICVRLDGLPLAIELAAARIRLLSPEAMLARLGHGLALLTGGPRDLPARQQTLRGAIAWSYDLLDDAEQRLFRRLGVFVGGCTIESAEGIGDLDESLGLDVLDSISPLVAGSLVRQQEQPDGEPRFSMLETIREYALERLEESGEAPLVRRRHGEHFLALIEEAAPHLIRLEGATWMDRLQLEHDNLRAALGWGSAAPDTADLMARVAGPFWWFWWMSGHLTEGRR